MKGFSREAEQIMIDRFGKDTVVALATTENEIPHVRYVNAYYENGVFYIITHALSNKMKHIKDNPVAAVAGEWFTAHGKCVNLGYFRKKENCEIAGKLKKSLLNGLITVILISMMKIRSKQFAKSVIVMKMEDWKIRPGN